MKRPLSALVAASMLLMGVAQGAAIHPPKAMTTIPEKAFMGSQNVRKLILHENIERIESMAFADTGIESVYALDVSGVEIAPDAFDGKTLFLFPMTTDTLTIARGDKFTLQYGSLPQDLQGKVTFSSQKPSVAKVSSGGVVSGILNGTTEIILQDEGGAKAGLTVRVKSWAALHDHIAIAHRGASGYRTENTLAAFQYANKLKADMVELDVYKTADGEIICIHDPYVYYNGRKTAVSSLTLSQIRSVRKNTCTLQEALDYIETTPMQLQVEFKVAGIEKTVLNLVKAAGMQDRTCYGSFDYAILKKIKSLDSTARTVYILNAAAAILDLRDHPEKYNVNAASIRYDYLSAKLICTLHLADMQVYGWTINTRADAQKYASMGLDGVITDYPDYV